MPKRTLTKPKPDPLAKVSAPNLRRMVKRLRADERRLTRVCQSHHERYLQTLARVMELENRIANLRQNCDNHVRVAESLVERNDRLAAELSALQREQALPPVETKAGPTWMGVTKKVASPDPAPAAVVVRATLEPWRLGASGWCDWDGERYDHRARNEGTHVLTLPAMPGMTLGEAEVFNPRTVWGWLCWDWRRSPLTCPAVADSPWPGVMHDNGLGEKNTAASWGAGGALLSCVRQGYGWHDYPLPPATWRQA